MGDPFAFGGSLKWLEEEVQTFVLHCYINFTALILPLSYSSI